MHGGGSQKWLNQSIWKFVFEGLPLWPECTKENLWCGHSPGPTQCFEMWLRCHHCCVFQWHTCVCALPTLQALGLLVAGSSDPSGLTPPLCTSLKKTPNTPAAARIAQCYLASNTHGSSSSTCAPASTNTCSSRALSELCYSFTCDSHWVELQFAFAGTSEPLIFLEHLFSAGQEGGRRTLTDITVQLKHISGSECQGNDSPLPAHGLWTMGHGLYHMLQSAAN